jgi:hypothetical protein
MVAVPFSFPGLFFFLLGRVSPEKGKGGGKEIGGR